MSGSACRTAGEDWLELLDSVQRLVTAPLQTTRPGCAPDPRKFPEAEIIFARLPAGGFARGGLKALVLE